ncbi:MAG: hypothetical protein ACK5OX_14150 [Desertimonas sp.]
MSALRPRIALVVAAAATVSLVGCGDDGGSSEAFCTAVADNLDGIVNPQLASQADAEAHVRLYEQVGADVPLAIEEEWGVLVDALQTSAAVVPDDPASVERARQAAFAAEEPAFAVFDWINVHCGLDLSTAGPVARFDPTASTAPTTTVAG